MIKPPRTRTAAPNAPPYPCGLGCTNFVVVGGGPAFQHGLAKFGRTPPIFSTQSVQLLELRTPNLWERPCLVIASFAFSGLDLRPPLQKTPRRPSSYAHPRHWFKLSPVSSWQARLEFSVLDF